MRARTQSPKPTLPFKSYSNSMPIKALRTVRKPRNAAEIECRLILELIREITPGHERDRTLWAWCGPLLHHEKNNIASYLESLRSRCIITPVCRYYMYSYADLYISVLLPARESGHCSITVYDYGSAPGGPTQTRSLAVPCGGFEQTVGSAA